MGIMAFGAFKIGSVELGLGQPLSAAHTVRAVLPVLIDQAMAPGAHFFRIDMHDSGAIIGRIFIAVLNEMTIKTAVVGAVI